MRYLQLIGNLLAKVLYPLRVNFTFFVFMFLLGYACSTLEVPRVKGYIPYEFATIELFLDLYVVCLILALIPNKIRRWIRATMYIIIYATCIVDVYCFVKFNSTLNPTMLLLIGETNASEASEFLRSYVSLDLLTSPPLSWILLIMIVHIAVNIIAYRTKTHPAVRRKLIGRMGRVYSRLSPSEKARVSIGAAAGGILGIALIILLINGYNDTIENKRATLRLMSYDNIGQVEHELTKKDKAVLYQPIYRLAFSVYANQLAANQVDRLIEGIEQATVDSCSFDSENIVLVIGESFNKHHSQLYGYDHPTTPRQMALKKEGRLIAFTDVVAPWNLTSFVFKNVFSLHAVGDSGEWCDYPLFPELFRNAGYKVTFITNQFLPRAREAVYDFSGGFFLNNPTLSRAQFDVRNTMLYRYDAGLLVDYDRIMEREAAKDSVEGSTHRGQFTILHLKGQHVGYRDRYPRSRKKFTRDDYNWEKLDKKSLRILADYDNATAYNDSIMGEIVRRFEDKDAIIVYMSDHGEEAFGDGMKIFGRRHSAQIDFRLAHEEFEVPFWIWCSEEYVRKHPDTFRRIKAAADRPFMTDNVAHLLLRLAGIRCQWYRADYDLLSDEYNENRPRVLKNTVDYNKLKADK